MLEDRGLCQLAEGQLRWVQAGLQWDGVPEDVRFVTAKIIKRLVALWRLSFI